MRGRTEMITHERAKDCRELLIEEIRKLYKLNINIKANDDLRVYIKQQKSKDKLLELYRKNYTMNAWNTHYEVWKKVDDQIKALEEKLK